MNQRANSSLLVWVAAIWMVAPGTSLAIGKAVSEDGEYSLEAIGSGRLTGAYLHMPDLPTLFPDGDDAFVAAVIRLILEGELGPFVDYEVNLYTDLSRVPLAGLGSSFVTAGSMLSPYRTTYLDAEFWEDGTVNGKLGIDRLAVHLSAEPVRLSVGRFPINYAVTKIFTPNDFFAPFSATAINTVYKPGVDALAVNVATGMLSSVEVVGVMGYADTTAPAWGKSALIARAATVLWNFEWAVIAGKLAQRWIVGASSQGELGPIGLRAEGHVGFPDQDGRGGIDDLDEDGREDIYGRLAGGLDVLFEWRNSNIGLEYLFVSNGAHRPGSYEERAGRLFPDDLLFVGRHYAGLGAGMELFPILRASILGMMNVEDLSGLAALTLVYSIADEADFVAGLMIPWGALPQVTGPASNLVLDVRSEFGAMPLTVFLESRFYF
jgi:hypothetical protein